MSLKYLSLLACWVLPSLANADVPIEAGIVSVFDTLKIYAWIVIVFFAFAGEIKERMDVHDVGIGEESGSKMLGAIRPCAIHVLI